MENEELRGDGWRELLRNLLYGVIMANELFARVKTIAEQIAYFNHLGIELNWRA
jgi:hypothetical protein